MTETTTLKQYCTVKNVKDITGIKSVHWFKKETEPELFLARERTPVCDMLISPVKPSPSRKLARSIGPDAGITGKAIYTTFFSNSSILFCCSLQTSTNNAAILE